MNHKALVALSRLAFGVALGALLVGCQGDHYSVGGLRRHIEDHLHVGASQEAIEAFFHAEGWSYNFDQYQSRYLSTYEPSRKEGIFVHSVTVVFIYVDENRRFKELKVQEIHTAL